MKADPAVFHQLHGVRKTRISYFKRDFLDYVLMIGLSGLVITLCYGGKHLMGVAGLRQVPPLKRQPLPFACPREYLELTSVLGLGGPNPVL
jgi:hypothetical protein